MSAFGDRLRHLRKDLGLSQEYLAQRAGLSPEAVSLLERGRRSPRMTTLQRLAVALRLTELEAHALFSLVERSDRRGVALPLLAGSLVDGDAAVDALVALLLDPDHRLVTVTGPPGVGKTRIAVEAAHRAAEQMSDGVYFLPVSPLSDPDTLLPAVSSTLGLHEHLGSVDELAEQLVQRHCLLVIDGGEHLADERARLVARLVGATRSLRVLVTSRELLHLPGEHVLTIAPLRVPPKGADPADLERTPASRLFLERAREHQPRLVVDHDDAAQIVTICRQLDGLPLAIELAAARSPVMSVSELADALDDSLDLLTAGEGPLQATLRWSYQLLSLPEQQLLRELSSFGASFDLDAIAAVHGDDRPLTGIVDLVTSLVGKSMVLRIEDTHGRARFSLLQVVRHHARQQLDASGRAETVQRRHAHHFLDLVLAAGHEPEDRTGVPLRSIDRELGNVAAAITWAIAADPPAALRLVAAMRRWCTVRGWYAQGRAWAHAALAAGTTAHPALRAPALAGAGSLAFFQCEYEVARELTAQALTLYEELGDDRGRWLTLSRLGSIARELGAYDDAEALHRQALRLADQLDDQRGVGSQQNYLSFVAWLRGDLERAADLGNKALTAAAAIGDHEGVAWALINCGVTALHRGDTPGARLLLSQSLELSTQLHFREGVAWSENQLGVLSRGDGDLEEAERLQHSSLDEHRGIGDRWRMASAFDELAAISLARGNPADAARWLGSADLVRQQIHTPVPWVEAPDRDRTETLTRQALGAAFAAAHATGLSRVEPIARRPDRRLNAAGFLSEQDFRADRPRSP